MYYVTKSADGPDPFGRRQAARAERLRRLEALRDEGHLLPAGPLPAIDGEGPGPAGYGVNLAVAAFDPLQAARTWAEADPYARAGIYGGVGVEPFRRVPR